MRPKLQVRETATADQCQGRHSGGSTAPRTRSKEASQLDSRFETLTISLAVHSRVDCRQKTAKLVDPQIAAMLPTTVRKTRVRRAHGLTPLTRRNHSAHNICSGNNCRDRNFGVDEHQPC